MTVANLTRFITSKCDTLPITLSWRGGDEFNRRLLIFLSSSLSSPQLGLINCSSLAELHLPTITDDNKSSREKEISE
jgi:hypothetical protein